MTNAYLKIRYHFVYKYTNLRISISIFGSPKVCSNLLFSVSRCHSHSVVAPFLQYFVVAKWMMTVGWRKECGIVLGTCSVFVIIMHILTFDHMKGRRHTMPCTTKNIFRNLANFHFAQTAHSAPSTLYTPCSVYSVHIQLNSCCLAYLHRRSIFIF